jgi:hypothetical protein
VSSTDSSSRGDSLGHNIRRELQQLNSQGFVIKDQGATVDVGHEIRRNKDLPSIRDGRNSRRTIHHWTEISAVADGGQIFVSSDFMTDIHRSLEIFADAERSAFTIGPK